MKRELLDAVPEGCCFNCFYAKGIVCNCRCGGEHHGHGTNRQLGE